MLDRLTTSGIAQLYPEQLSRDVFWESFISPSKRRELVRRHTPTSERARHHQSSSRGRRVLILTHQVVVLCFRYLLENLSEEQLLAIDREGDVANCAVTEYRFDATAGTDGALVLERYNFVAPLEEAGSITSDPT